MNELNLLPLPQHIEFGIGEVSLGVEPTISVPTIWIDLVRNSTINFRVQPESNANQVLVHLDPDLRDEEYILVIDNILEIFASTRNGLFYALAALESFDLDHLPIVRIRDYPQFSWRGCHLDVSRHFFSVETIFRYIKLLAEHRINKLHLHLNDDQGWRVEIPNWPLLTQVGAWRRSTPVGHEDDGVDGYEPHGGFYTKDDLVAIREYAAKHCIQIVPEIDLPGHAQAVLAAYPQFGNTSEHFEVWNRWGVSDHVLNVSEESLAFATEVVQYVAEIFPGSPVHIGGDECPTSEWENSSEAQEVMRSNGFTKWEQLQGLFTKRLAVALQNTGHEVIAWDEVLDSDVPAGVIIEAWRSIEKGVEAAERGLQVIMAPMDYLYLDWLNSNEPNEPIAQNPAPESISWEKVYSYQVIPDELIPATAALIRGAQVELWTEYIPHQDHLDYMSFPRICAFSEVIWGTASFDAEEFRPRLERHLLQHATAGVNFRPLDSIRNGLKT